MLRCTVLRAVVGVLAVVLLVAVPNLALGQQSVSEEDASVLDEEPILIISGDVCDIEIVPTSVDLLLVDPLNFYNDATNPDPDAVIRQMREADQLLMTTGCTVQLHCEREDVLFREARQRYMVSGAIKEGKTAIHDSQFSYSSAPTYQALKNYLANSPLMTKDGKPWPLYPEGSPLPFMRPVERIYYEHKKQKLFVEAARYETVWVASDNQVSRTDPSSNPSDLGVRIERSRRLCETATWFDISMYALGRFVSSMLGKGRSASWSDGRIVLVAEHHLYPEWEWHLVVDPQLRYLTVQAKLVDTATQKVLEQWQNVGVMQGNIPLAKHAVFTMEPDKSPAQLIVECRSYDECFDEKLYEETFQRIKQAKSFRDMRVEPFMDVRVK